jgi:hypothetical protein
MLAEEDDDTYVVVNGRQLNEIEAAKVRTLLLGVLNEPGTVENAGSAVMSGKLQAST